MAFLDIRRELPSVFCAAGLAATIATVCVGSAAAQQTRRVTLPAGTVIPVQLNTTLSSKSSQPGDKFTATVKYGRDDAGLPEGTRIAGVVREAIPHGDGKPGVLDMDIHRIIFPGNESRPIEASVYSLDGKAVTRRDGRLVASANASRDRMKWVGIGAGAGLVLSTLVRGNTLVDTLLGAGAGYLFNELQSKKPGDVNLRQGQEFGVRLDRPITFDMDRRDNYRDHEGRIDDPADRDRQNREDRPREGADPDHDSGTVNDIGMVINDREVRFERDARPFMRNDIVFLPLNAVGRAANVDFRYDAADRMIFARDRSVRLALDSRIAIVSGERRRLPAAAEMRHGEVYVPMQFVRYLTNGSVSWDAGSRTVVVTTDRDRS